MCGLCAIQSWCGQGEIIIKHRSICHIYVKCIWVTYTSYILRDIGWTAATAHRFICSRRMNIDMMAICCFRPCITFNKAKKNLFLFVICPNDDPYDRDESKWIDSIISTFRYV